MRTTAARGLDTTLHAALCALRPDIPRTVVSKSAMTTASHLVEDLVLGAEEGTVLVSCFQDQRFFEAHRAKYDELARTCTVVALYAAGDAAPPALTLGHDHPMVAEWFVLALGPSLSVTLCGLGLPEPGDADAERTFDAFLSTDPDLARAAVAFVADTLSARIPAQAAELLRATVLRPHEPTRTQLSAQADVLLAGMFGRVERLRRQEREAHDRAMHLHEQLLFAAERERRRLAEALHDESLQLLLAASQDLHEIAADPGDEALAAAKGHLGRGLHFLRETLSGMHVEDRPSAPLETRLELICRGLERRGGFALRLDVDPAAAGGADEQVCAFVRELVTNAAKHAGAETVRVGVELDAGRSTITVEVADDGVGADLSTLAEALTAGHIGLSLAQERVEDGGGTWAVTTAPGKGLVARATLPASAS